MIKKKKLSGLNGGTIISFHSNNNHLFHTKKGSGVNRKNVKKTINEVRRTINVNLSNRAKY